MKEKNRNPHPGGDADQTMRTCAAGGFQKLLVALVFLALLLPVTLYALYMGLLEPSLPWAKRLVFLAGGALFGALTAWGAYRTLYLGIGWVEYNDETVIFHWDRSMRSSGRAGICSPMRPPGRSAAWGRTVSPGASRTWSGP